MVTSLLAAPAQNTSPTSISERYGFMPFLEHFYFSDFRKGLVSACEPITRCQDTASCLKNKPTVVLTFLGVFLYLIDRVSRAICLTRRCTPLRLWKILSLVRMFRTSKNMKLYSILFSF